LGLVTFGEYHVWVARKVNKQGRVSFVFFSLLWKNSVNRFELGIEVEAAKTIMKTTTNKIK